MTDIVLFSLIVFLPAAAGLVLLAFPKGQDAAVKWFALATTAVVFALTVWLAIPASGGVGQFDLGAADMQHMFRIPWISSFNIFYSMGVDGISLPLVVLTSFLSVLAMAASWPIAKHVKAYCALFLLLETGMLGVFMALDFFLFYVFWK